VTSLLGSSRRITVALVGLVVFVLAGWLVREQLVEEPAAAGPRVVALSELPTEAAETWRLIERGGPYPYPDDDGSVFQNREGLLPAEDPGYYREYTVATPGSADRGQRRLVTGAEQELYYTDDHYESFVTVDPDR
jgi:guanyl-specific ribonuclease Sa